MLIAEILIDSAVGFKYLSSLYGYLGYNQIFIAEKDVPNTEFRCLCSEYGISMSWDLMKI